jgi:hypothetical protein
MIDPFRMTCCYTVVRSAQVHKLAKRMGRTESASDEAAVPWSVGAQNGGELAFNASSLV